MVICTEQQSQNAFHLSLLQNIHISAKDRCRLVLKPVKFCSIYKHLHVYCLMGGQNEVSSILVFMSYRYPIA